MIRSRSSRRAARRDGRHGSSEPGAKQPRADLHEAARIAGGDELRGGGGDVLQLALEHDVGHVRLHEVVDAGASAADIALVERHQLELGNCPQHVERRSGDALRVQQMTGRVVRDPAPQPAPPRAGPRRREQLAHVAHFRRNLLRPQSSTPASSCSRCGYSFIIAPQPAAFTQM